MSKSALRPDSQLQVDEPPRPMRSASGPLISRPVAEVTPSVDQIAAERGWLAGHPWAAVVLLMFIGVLNLVDRGLPAILAEPIKRDLQLSDTTLGLINGLGFLAVYALASIPLARVSDRGGYKLVIAIALAVWSAMTMLGGMVAHGWQLAATRVGVALGEAGGTPAAHAYITRHLPRAKRTLAISIFSLNIPIGATAGLVVGGVGGEVLGWRNTFVALGLIGLILAAITFLCFGARHVRASDASESMKSVASASIGVLLRKRSLIAILAASSFVGMGGYTAMAFTPAFLMRTHGMSVSEAGVSYGLAGGAGSIIGLLLIGWLSDRLAMKDSRWLIGTVVVMIVLCLPFAIVAFNTTNLKVAMFGLVFIYTVSVSYAAPVYAALHRLAPVELRARASALLLLSAAILGGVGPVLAGMVSDLLQPTQGPGALGSAMLIIPASYLMAAMIYVLSLRTFRNELVEEEGHAPVRSAR